MKRIVIIGGGFGGAYCAQELEKRSRHQRTEIVLINKENHFVFTPLLVEAGTGAVEPRHAVVPLRAFLHMRTSRFICGEVAGISEKNRQVFYRVVGTDDLRAMEYDHLVVALGGVTRLPPVPGLSQFGFELKSVPDAIALRDRAIELLERADATDDREARRDMLRFVVVGASFSGVEIAGEFHEFLREATRYYRNVSRKDCSVTLVEREPRILPALDEDLAEYAAEKMRSRGMDLLLDTSVKEVRADNVVLDTGEALPTSTLIWCAGIKPTPLASRLGLPCNSHGIIECERDLRVKDRDNVWAIGDCASNLDREGDPYPATAQHALRQGRRLARNLVRVLEGREAKPCDITNLGSLAALGCRTGVAKVLGVKLSGFPAWFLWRTVYLMKMPGFARKVRVALDWTMSLVFRRTIVQIGVPHPTLRNKEPEPAEDGAPGDQRVGVAEAPEEALVSHHP